MSERPGILVQIIRHKSAIVLIAANLVPLTGAILGAWDAFEIIFLYCLENVVIGFFNICKLLTLGIAGRADDGDGAKPRPSRTPGERLATLLGAVFLSGFFVFHYGIFASVHGTFVLAFRELAGSGPRVGVGSPFDITSQTLDAITGPLLFPFLGLAASHGFSFIYNYLVRGEYKQVTLDQQMMAPYGRVIIMHLTVLFGGMLSLLLPHFMLAVLVLLKTAVDLMFHLKERETGAISPFSMLTRRRQRATAKK